MPPLVRRISQFPVLRLPVASLSTRFLKYLVFVLFLVNVRSWPLSWHFRVFHPVTVLRLRFVLLHFPLLFKPAYVRQRAKAKWLAGLSPVGKNPLDISVAWGGWASPDDCDFNLHLSNSCYAKSLDCARLNHAMKCFPTFLRTGGLMALGGTHYNFLREIPILWRYEVRVSIVAWDNKWIYIVSRFVSRPSKKSKSKSTSHAANQLEIKLPPTPPETDARTSHVPVPALHTPASPDTSESEAEVDTTSKQRSSSPPTPVSPTFPNAASNSPAARRASSVARASGAADSAAVAKALHATVGTRMHTEPDGATLHCVAVSAMCFKIGRITVPPALVIASEGLCSGPESMGQGQGPTTSESAKPQPPQKPQTYSHAHPPPHWPHVLRLRGSELDLRGLRAFFAGGWRKVPDEEQWWEPALGGELERRRKAGMEVVGVLRKGMEATQRL